MLPHDFSATKTCGTAELTDIDPGCSVVQVPISWVRPCKSNTMSAFCGSVVIKSTAVDLQQKLRKPVFDYLSNVGTNRSGQQVINSRFSKIPADAAQQMNDL